MKKIFTLFLLALTVSAFAVNVTYEVSMKGSGGTYDSVFIVGTLTDWAFVQMEDQGDSLFSVSINQTAGDTAVYYFITIGYWATDYLQYREVVPEECALSDELTGDAGWTSDRAHIVPTSPITYSCYWGTCDEVTPGTGINDRDASVKTFELFPNPCSEIVSIQLFEIGNGATIMILDISGKIVKSFESSANEIAVDVSDLSGGLYLTRIQSGNNTMVRKLIVQ